MSRVDGGNRPSLPPKRSEFERSERSDVTRDTKPGAAQGRTPANANVRSFQGRSDFEPARPAPASSRPTPAQTPAVKAPPSPADAESIAQADMELGLLEEFPDADAQSGIASAMLHAHADAPVSQNRIVERLKQDGRLETLFGEVFREDNPYVEQPHKNAIVKALDTALSRGTVTGDDLRAFSRGTYAQEWQQIGAALGTTRK
ncbi:hypothetical protein NR800_31905 [Corallococcus interemptor]|uniref:hypothetical protein n=1 Tax=Corallococcus TaxID=83461 RepID=UPI001CBF5591|nr:MULTISPECIES: hypothetical protein [unclassified Corallococcus]MBZ4336238.1 hypothetical protein [Corallococcus sp. AS-1-12]MBZ4375804.1 hypothetical protein [Corallococcus sp. AS-1-6]